MKEKENKQQMLRVTIIARGDFRLDELDNLSSWQDDIKSYGEIVNQQIEIVDQ